MFWQKVDLGRPAAILWTCHVATLLMAVGLALRSRPLVEAMTLFHLAAGLPGWLTDWIIGGSTTWSSAFSHLSTPLVGALALGGRRPRWSAFALAWGLYMIMLPVARLTPEALNVNSTWRPWGPARAHLPSGLLWTWGPGIAATGLALALVVWAGRRWLPR